ncbi:MAG TPA: hypothetical protein PKY96_13960 [Flavobacteriales bacterium]|nr:hypothetical protein [Flavobacteriales bacterium]
MRNFVSGYPGNGLDGGLQRDSLEARMGAELEGCTMEGEAHMALLDNLLPLITQFRELPGHPTPA